MVAGAVARDGKGLTDEERRISYGEQATDHILYRVANTEL